MSEDLNVAIDVLVRVGMKIVFGFYLFASLFPATGFVVDVWVFVWMSVISWSLFLERPINHEGVSGLRMWIAMCVGFVVVYAISGLWLVGIIGMLLAIIAHSIKPIKRAFVSGFLLFFWVIHFWLAFKQGIPFLEYVKKESFEQTVFSWKILFVVGVAFVYSLCFKGYDAVAVHASSTKKEKVVEEATEEKEERLRKEIEEATTELHRTTDEEERQRLIRYIMKREGLLLKYQK